MKLAGKTDVGRVRQENQDDYRAGELPGGAVWALVCDGMGGAGRPRGLSRGPAMSSNRCFRSSTPSAEQGEESFLKKALISANRYVFNKAAHEE